MEKIRYGMLGFVGSLLLFYLFYQNIFITGFLSVPGTVAFLWYEGRVQAEKRREQMAMEFKDAMDSMISALTAGYSMENAVSECYQDLLVLYGKETPILLELKEMKQKIGLKVPLDRQFLELGRKTGIEDITTFAQIYSTARKSGGNLVKVMKRTADNIGEKIEVQREIETMVAGKKMEANCMMAIPLLIILYLQIFSPGFLDPLYRGAGRLVMTGALVLYGAAVLWSRAILSLGGVR